MSFIGRRLMLSYVSIGAPIGFIMGSDCYYFMTNQQKTNNDLKDIWINYPVGVMSLSVSLVCSLTWPVFVLKGIYDSNSNSNTNTVEYKKSIDV